MAASKGIRNDTFLFTIRLSECYQITAVCSSLSRNFSLWLLRRGTNSFCGAITKDCDKVREFFEHQLSPQ